MKKFWINILILIILLMPTHVLADDDGSEFQTWFDLTTRYQITENWRYYGDQGFRGVLSGNDFNQAYFRPAFMYRVNPDLSLRGGVRFFGTTFDDSANTFEVGPWQGLQYIWPRFDEYRFTHYFRLEERFIWQSGESDFSLRGRYQLGFITPNYSILNTLFEKGISFSTSLEFFWDIEDNFNEIVQNRLRYDIGVRTVISDKWEARLHYILQDARESDQGLFEDFLAADEHILRLRLFYWFN